MVKKLVDRSYGGLVPGSWETGALSKGGGSWDVQREPQKPVRIINLWVICRG